MSTLAEKLSQAALHDKRDDFVNLVLRAPVTIENFHDAWDASGLADNSCDGRWLMEGVGERLWTMAQDPVWWSSWSSAVPGLDLFLLSTDPDGRWFEYLRFRWTTANGQPQHMPPGDDPQGFCRSEFLKLGWKNALLSRNIVALTKMLNDSVWRKALTSNIVAEAAHAPVEVWEVLDQHQVALPLRELWRLNMMDSQSRKFAFLTNHPSATAEFAVQQYLHGWKYRHFGSPPLDFFARTRGWLEQVSLSSEAVEAFNDRLAVSFVDSANKGLVGQVQIASMTNLLEQTPVFDHSVFVRKTLNIVAPLNLSPSCPAVVILSDLIDRLNETNWQQLIAERPSDPLLLATPRGQRHTLLNAVGPQNESVASLKKM